MIKRRPEPIVSEENEYNNQFYSWLHDSHYWIVEEDFNVYYCKWCNRISPVNLEHSSLCLKNPEILKLLSKFDNPVNNK